VDTGRDIPYRAIILEAKQAACTLGVPVLNASRGSVYRTDDLETEILLTVDDLVSPPSDPNETSMIFRVKVAGQTILFTGDTYQAPAKQLAAEMGDALKCDFCQLAHHALNGGHEDLYNAADPKIALVPMARPAYDAMTIGKYKEKEGTRPNREVLQRLPESAQWVAADGDRVVELPFAF
jgi:beta-lactamase superfamily II metal-dependent hydrolase